MSLQNPNIPISIVSGAGTPTIDEQKILVLGQKLASGTATSGALIQDFKNYNEIDGLFGAKSQIARTLRSMLIKKKELNSPFNPQIDIIPLDPDGAATGAQAKIEFSGTATEDGQYEIIIGSELNHKYTLPVLKDETGAELADKLEVLINADQYVPVTIANDTLGTLDFTSTNPGEVDNNMSNVVTGDVDGITVLTLSFAAGATNPDLTNVFDVVQLIRYQAITAPGCYGRQYLEDFLEPRFNTGTYKILNGRAFVANTDTFANLIDLVNPATGLNNTRNIVTLANRLVDEPLYRGGGIREFDDVIAAQVAFIVSLRLTDNATLDEVVTAAAAKTNDNRGGPALASLPYFNTRGFDLPLINLEHEWTPDESTEAEIAGLTLIGNDPTRTFIELGNAVTAYKKDPEGFNDESFKYLNFLDTYTIVRELFHKRLLQAFPQNRLSVANAGASASNRMFVDQRGIIAALIKIYGDLASDDYLLTAGDQDAVTYFKNNLNVEVIKRERKAVVSMKVPINSQLGKIDITLITELNV